MSVDLANNAPAAFGRRAAALIGEAFRFRAAPRSPALFATVRRVPTRARRSGLVRLVEKQFPILLSFILLTDLATQFNPTMRSWISYYGRFHRSALAPVFRPLNYALVCWAMRKYPKRFQGHKWRTWQWLLRAARREPTLFAQWELLRMGAAER